MNQALEKREQRQDLAAVEQGNFGRNSLAKLNMRELKELATVFVESGQFNDVKQVAQAMVKIIAGSELGFSPIVSMTGIHFFQGKVTIGANLMASLIKESPKYDYKITENTAEACTIVFYQDFNGEMKQMGVPVRYTYKEATAAGLTGKDNWKKFPVDMLFAAAIRQGTRRYCADVLRGTTADSETDNDAEYVPVSELPEPALIGQVVTASGEPADAVVYDAATDTASAESFNQLLTDVNELLAIKLGGDLDEIEKFLDKRKPGDMSWQELDALKQDLAAL